MRKSKLTLNCYCSLLLLYFQLFSYSESKSMGLKKYHQKNRARSIESSKWNEMTDCRFATETWPKGGTKSFCSLSRNNLCSRHLWNQEKLRCLKPYHLKKGWSFRPDAWPFWGMTGCKIVAQSVCLWGKKIIAAFIYCLSHTVYLWCLPPLYQTMLICMKKSQQQEYSGTEQIFMLWTKKNYTKNCALEK